MVSYLGNGITFPVAHAGDIEASGIAFIVVATVLILLRGFSLTFRKATLGSADVFALASWLVIVGMGSVFIWSAEQGGLGSPTPTGEPPLTAVHITDYQKLILQSEYVFCILMVVALGTTKLSILFFFRSIFLTHRRTFWDLLTRALIILVALWTVAFTLAFALECGGYTAAFWQPLEIRVQHCLAINGGIAAIEKACGITDLVLDLCCIALPFPIIWRLHLPLSRKLSVTGIFMVGLMTIAASIARLVIWVEVLNTAANPTEDVNLAVAMSLYWGMIEAGLGFVASQLPALSTYLNKDSQHQITESLRYAASVISLRSFSGSHSINRKAEDREQHSKSDGKINTTFQEHDAKTPRQDSNDTMMAC